MEYETETREARVLDSITKLAPEDAGRVVIAGSHGGSYAAYCAARGRVRAVVLNDAGVGWEQAAGMAVAQAALRLADARMAPTQPAPRKEARCILATAADGTPRVVGADSVSLLGPADDGLIAVTASHGERLAGLASDGVRAEPRLVTFNDAGIGKDSAGIGRLPLLQQRGIAALTVSAHSARIGDARSCFEDGVVSSANARARDLGCRVGTPLKTFIDALLTGRAIH